MQQPAALFSILSQLLELLPEAVNQLPAIPGPDGFAGEGSVSCLISASCRGEDVAVPKVAVAMPPCLALPPSVKASGSVLQGGPCPSWGPVSPSHHLGTESHGFVSLLLL